MVKVLVPLIGQRPSMIGFSGRQGRLLLKYYRRSAYSLAFEVDYHFNTVGDLYQRNAFMHPIILTIEGHRPFNLTRALITNGESISSLAA
jgi:hypothetical protein